MVLDVYYNEVAQNVKINIKHPNLKELILSDQQSYLLILSAEWNKLRAKKSTSQFEDEFQKIIADRLETNTFIKNKKAKLYNMTVVRDPYRNSSAYDIKEIWFEHYGNDDNNQFNGGYCYNSEGNAFACKKPRNEKNTEIEIEFTEMQMIKNIVECHKQMQNTNLFKCLNSTSITN